MTFAFNCNIIYTTSDTFIHLSVLVTIIRVNNLFNVYPYKLLGLGFIRAYNTKIYVSTAKICYMLYNMLCNYAYLYDFFIEIMSL